MEKQEIIELLRKDMAGEQQAIIQYLFHAYALGEGEVAAEIEAIAREEMYHLDWLADAIVELGGEPNMQRDPVDFGQAAPPKQLLKNVGLEQMAIDQYRAHIEMIEDPSLQRLLSRILHDELDHKGQFEHLAEKLAAEAAAAPEGHEGEPQAPSERLAAILNGGIRHEYSVVLQYLYHSFVAENSEVAEQLQNTAINEMQHMGWLAEELAGSGGTPEMEHGELFLTHDVEANLAADIAVEQEVTRDYTSQLSEIDDPGLQHLVKRIRDHEIFHDALFKDLLAEVKEEQASGAGEEAGSAAPCPPAEPPMAQTPPPPKPDRRAPTVGSLIDQHK
jgi:bacterioferritin